MFKSLRFLFCFLLGFATFSAASAQCPVNASCTPSIATNAGQGFGCGIYKVVFNSINKTSGGDTDGYQDYSCTTGTGLLQGNSYTLTVTTGTSIQENVRVWIDYDNNGSFDPSTELVFISNNKMTNHSGSVTISSSSVIGTALRMRVSADAYVSPIPTPCSTPQYSQVEDYKVTINTNSAPPQSLFSVNDTVSCIGNFTFTDLSQNVPTSWKWYFGDGNISSLQNPTHAYTATGRYSVTLVTQNANGKDSLTKVNYVNYSANVPVAASCIPVTSSYCCGYGIYKVEFNTISNSSPDGAEGYKDFSCNIGTTVYAGTNYTLKVTTSTSNNQDTRAWIDYNNDGVFTSSEMVMQKLNMKTPSVTVNVPGTAVQNVPLRMRISSDYTGPNFGPCTNMNLGQTEDYRVIIVPNTAPPVANFYAPGMSLCDSVVTFADSSMYTISSWKWYFGDGDSSSVQNPTHEYQSPGTYTVTLVVTGPYGTSTKVRTNYVIYSASPKAASCTPGTSTFCCDMGIKNFTFNTINNTTGNGSLGYQDFTCSHSTILSAGNNYSVSVRNGSQYAENVRVWIDYDNNGAFSASELVFSSDNLQQHTGTISISNSAASNVPLRLRVGSDWTGNTPPDFCTNVTYGQFEDYSVYILSNMPPAAAFGATDSVSCSTTISFVDRSGFAPTSWKWYFGDGDSSSVQNPVHTYASTGMYTVKLVVTNANGSNSITRTNFINITSNTGASPASCKPATTSACCAAGIFNVQLNTINNTTQGSATESYRNFACSQSTNLIAGASYTMNVRTGQNVPEYVKVWIDFNNDRVFNNATELVFTSNNVLQNHTGSITIPGTAVQNTPLRMRVASDLNVLADACTSPANSQVEDYTVVITANTSAPSPDFTSDVTSTCTGDVAFTDISQFLPTSWKWYFGDGDSSTAQNPTHTYAAVGLYTVTLYATNAFGTNSVVKTNYINVVSTQGASAASCMPATLSHCCGIGISNVTIGTINNTTAVGSDGYQDYACGQFTELNEGATYQISVTTGTQYNENVALWIDLNNNAQLETSEKLFTSSALTNHTGNITIPTGSVLNQGLRMRVMSDFNPITASCNDVQYGQAEDYVVQIKQNTQPPVANFTADVTQTCDGVVNFTDISTNVPSSWKWYFGDGDSASVKNPTHTYTSAGTFTVTLIATNSFGSNTIVKTAYINVIATSGVKAAVCTPATTSTCCGIGIYKFVFNTITNTTAPGTDGYKDYSCEQSTTVISGNSYSISIETGNQYMENVYAWIDYNDNGDLENSELVFQSYQMQYHSGTVNIPANVLVANKFLRMRIGSDFNTITSSCNTINWGQYEDYGVNIYKDMGIGDYASSASVKIHPNPSNGQFTIEMPETGTLSEVSVKDMLGREVYKGNITSSAELNLTHLDRGIYTVIVKTEKQQIIKKVVIEK